MSKIKKYKKIVSMLVIAMLLFPLNLKVSQAGSNNPPAFTYPAGLTVDMNGAHLNPADFYVNPKSGMLIDKTNGRIMDRMGADIFNAYQEVSIDAVGDIYVGAVRIYEQSTGKYWARSGDEIDILTGQAKNLGFSHSDYFMDPTGSAVHIATGYLVNSSHEIIYWPSVTPNRTPHNLVDPHTGVIVYDFATYEYRDNVTGQLVDMATGMLIGSSSSDDEDDDIINSIPVQNPASSEPVEPVSIPAVNGTASTEMPKTIEKIADIDMSTPITEIYSDISKDSWYKCSVNYVVKNGLMVGTSSNRFSPNESVSKSMLLSVLYKLSNSPKEKHISYIADAQNWDKDAIHWAVNHSIALPNEDGIFKGADAISREELISILYKYTKYRGISTSSTVELGNYDDSNKISTDNIDAMKWAVKEGIISGTTDNRLLPQGMTTRAEFSSILRRYADNVVK